VSITPRFSVVIPTRGDAPHLRQALASALAQGPDLEAILAHPADAPLPGDLFFDHRIVAVATDRGTPGGARNAALALARAPYVAFLDDDDLWLPGHLAHAGAELDRDPSIVAVATDAWLFSDATPGGSAEPPVDVETLPRFLGPGPALEPTASQLLVRNVLLTPTVVARLSALRAAGGFDGALAAMEDWDLWMRLCRQGPVLVLRESRVIVRRRPDSASRDLRAMASCALEVADRAIEGGTAISEPDRRTLFGRLSHDLAYACLRAGDARGARAAARRAIALLPRQAVNYLYWFAGLAPPSLLRLLFRP
jgi:glycosyltransferase involved in cell wall biosynthesis